MSNLVIKIKNKEISTSDLDVIFEGGNAYLKHVKTGETFSCNDFIDTLFELGVATKSEKLANVYTRNSDGNLIVEKKMCDVISVKPDSKVVVIINKV